MKLKRKKKGRDREKRNEIYHRTFGVMRWQPRLWGGRTMVFWAHLEAMDWSVLVEMAGVYCDFTRRTLVASAAAAEMGFDAKKTEACICIVSRTPEPDPTKIYEAYAYAYGTGTSNESRSTRVGGSFITRLIRNINFHHLSLVLYCNFVFKWFNFSGHERLCPLKFWMVVIFDFLDLSSFPAYVINC